MMHNFSIPHGTTQDDDFHFVCPSSLYGSQARILLIQFGSKTLFNPLPDFVKIQFLSLFLYLDSAFDEFQIDFTSMVSLLYSQKKSEVSFFLSFQYFGCFF